RVHAVPQPDHPVLARRVGLRRDLHLGPRARLCDHLDRRRVVRRRPCDRTTPTPACVVSSATAHRKPRRTRSRNGQITVCARTNSGFYRATPHAPRSPEATHGLLFFPTTWVKVQR